MPMNRTRTLGAGALAVATAAGVLLAAQRASACGGFFCNRPQNPTELPVAQTAENVLFAMDRTADGKYKLEAHIQIFYTGPADKFSWVVPVDSLPTLSTGSDQIFTLLAAATQPQFQLDLRDEGTCRDGNPAIFGGTGGGGGAVPTPPMASATQGGGGVTVEFRGSVGPFDAAVIKAGDPMALKDWLRENMYYLSDEGAKLIDVYVLEQKHFVALKLQPGKGNTEIRPIVLRFEGPGPCVPLRLTAVAALRDLGINLWVLAEHRVVPENYYEIVLNEARIDWLRNGQNYRDLIKQAADEAGGNAFAVDFAADTPTMELPLLQVDLTRLRTIIVPPDALDEIARLGLPRDATLLQILRKHIPEPQLLKDMKIDEVSFYNQLRVYWEQYRAAFDPVDGDALAADIETEILAPLRNARTLFQSHRKLTRLATFISPEEMSVDPTFIENTTLPDVPAVRQAKAFRACGNRDYTWCKAPIRVELSDGRKVWFKSPGDAGWCGGPGPYDRAGVDGAPALEVGWKRAAAGDGQMKFDNRAAIASAVTTQNNSVQSGCSCALGSRTRGAPLWLLGLAALLIARRRRPR
jgi:MYXO-CTERM domain-containing protein